MKDFKIELQNLHITHWWTYPKSPEMNAHRERYNHKMINWLVVMDRYTALTSRKYSI